MYIHIFILFLTGKIISQENAINCEIPINFSFVIDSLENKSYKEIFELIKREKDFNLKISYTQYFFLRAKKERDSLNIARGFYFIFKLNKTKENIHLLDSIVNYSHSIDNSYYPYIAHREKGIIANKDRNFKKALDFHLEALKLSKFYKNIKQINKTKLSIALLKERAGQDEEALKIYKECLAYKEQQINFNKIQKNSTVLIKNYLNNLILLSNSFRKNEKLDSTIYTLSKIKKLSYLKESEKYITLTKLIEAEVYLAREQFPNAIKNCNFVLPKLIKVNDLKNIAIAYHVRGLSYKGLNRKEEALKNFKSVDSIFNIINDLSPELRKGYEFLIDNFKKHDDVKSQLYYVEQLLKYDSIIHNNYAYISENLTKKFDTPRLVLEKEILEKQLSQSNNNLYYWVLGTIGISIAIFIIIIRVHRDQLKVKLKENKNLKDFYEREFDKLLNQKNITLKKEKQIDRKNEAAKLDLNISKEVIHDILNKLKIFEDLNEFTNTELNAVDLAKSFGTNQSYLAKIIKFNKGKTFRTYINDLRIELALKKLRNETGFRNYSIVAIANEVGFKNAEPFAKAFNKRIGIYPSEFISDLQSIANK